MNIHTDTPLNLGPTKQTEVGRWNKAQGHFVSRGVNGQHITGLKQAFPISPRFAHSPYNL